jgi:hypothetical protein
MIIIKLLAAWLGVSGLTILAVCRIAHILKGKR